MIFHITFWHSWVNDAQADEGGEIFYNSLALRGGSFGSENDPAIAPNILESTNLIYMVNVLTAIKYGYILKNEDDSCREGYVAQRKHSSFPPSSPGFKSQHCRDFSSLLLSWWTVLRLNPSSAKQWISQMQSAVTSRAKYSKKYLNLLLGPTTPVQLSPGGNNVAKELIIKTLEGSQLKISSLNKKEKK